MLQAAALRGTGRVAEARYITRKINGRPPGVTTRQGPRQEWIIERTGDPNLEDLEPFLKSLRGVLQARAAGGAG